MADDLAPHYELAYEEAKRALDAQQQVVNELRSRTGVLMAAAAITTSFFGGQALDGDHVGIAGWIAIACFGFLGIAVLAILWPQPSWAVTVNAKRFIATYIERQDGPRDLPTVHRDLALHMSASYVANGQQLRRLSFAFRAGAALLVGEAAAWVAGILDGP